MLKKKLAISLATIFCVALFLPTPKVAAQEKPVSIKVGVVDWVQITRKSLMSLDMARQISARRNKFRKEISAAEDSLRKESDNLQQQRHILAPEAFKKASTDHRRKFLAAQRISQQRTQELLRLRAFAEKQVEREKAKALLAVSKQHGFTLIFNARSVLLRDDALDITNLVLKILDKNRSSFKLPDTVPEAGK